MTEEENNIMIGNYLNWKVTEGFYFKTPFFQSYLSSGAGICETSTFGFSELRFHNSWDWLMYAVEYINKEINNPVTAYNGFKIQCDTVFLYGKNYLTQHSVGKKEDGRYKDLKECVYRSVVDYIIWKTKKDKVEYEEK